MRSKANIKSHPIHPILVSFPITFLTAAFLASVYGVVTENERFWSYGPPLILAGIVTALIAAVPGIIDYIFVVPPKSSAKKRATYHMLVNSCAVLLYALSYYVWSNDGISNAPSLLVLILLGVGTLIMGMGGWLGGTLVYRNQIGVDHRYANSGKWKESRIDASPGKIVTAATTDELQIGQMKLLHVGDKRIVLGRAEDGYVAFDDRCTHKGASLADGSLVCGKVQCPWHGSQFDVRTGAIHAGPAKENIQTYRVSEDNGSVLVTV